MSALRYTGMSRRRSAGMTIIEMLVVVTIISLLVAIAYPALQGVQVRNRKLTEMNDIRTVHQAWTIYSNFNRDIMLPGYIEEDVQTAWRTHYEYPIPPDPAQPQNLIIPAAPASPWTWRLMPYFDHGIDTIWRYRGLNTNLTGLAAMARDSGLTSYGIMDENDLMLAIAEQPGFAYNAFHIGGWWEMIDIGGIAVPKPRFFDATLPGAGSPAADVISTRLPAVRRPSAVIAFCSAARYTTQAVQRRYDNELAGTHFVTAPWWQMSDPHWESPALATPGSTIGRPTLVETWPNAELDNAAHAPFGRYNDRVTFVNVDGSSDSAEPATLNTPMRWIDAATTDDFEFVP